MNSAISQCSPWWLETTDDGDHSSWIFTYNCPLRIQGLGKKDVQSNFSAPDMYLDPSSFRLKQEQRRASAIGQPSWESVDTGGWHPGKLCSNTICCAPQRMSSPEMLLLILHGNQVSFWFWEFASLGYWNALPFANSHFVCSPSFIQNHPFLRVLSSSFFGGGSV